MSKGAQREEEEEQPMGKDGHHALGEKGKETKLPCPALYARQGVVCRNG